MESDGEDEQDQEKEDEKEEVVVDEDVEEDEDSGKEPRTMGQGEMVNTLVDDADTMVEDEETVQPNDVQDMRKDT